VIGRPFSMGGTPRDNKSLPPPSPRSGGFPSIFSPDSNPPSGLIPSFLFVPFGNVVEPSFRPPLLRVKDLPAVRVLTGALWLPRLASFGCVLHSARCRWILVPLRPDPCVFPLKGVRVVLRFFVCVFFS